MAEPKSFEDTFEHDPNEVYEEQKEIDGSNSIQAVDGSRQTAYL